MKKTLSVVLALAMTLSLAACGKQGEASGSADASGSHSGSHSGSQAQTPSGQNYVVVKGTDTLPTVTADNEIYFDKMPSEDKEPIIEPVLEETYAMSSATGKPERCNGVEYEYKGSTELPLGTFAQVDMIIGGEPVFSFFIDRGSSCYAAAENGGMLLVNKLPIEETQLIGDAEKNLDQIYHDWMFTDYEDTFEDEATGVEYGRIDEEGRTNPEELRASYGETFSAKKADAVLEEAMKVLKEKDGAYYAPSDLSPKKEGYAFVVYAPVEIGADKMTFKQIPYFYEMDEEENATGLYQNESEICECVVIKEDGRWVIDQYTLPY